MAQGQLPEAAAHARSTSQLKEVSKIIQVQLGQKKILTNAGWQQRVVEPISAYATDAKKGTDASPKPKSKLAFYFKFIEL